MLALVSINSFWLFVDKAVKSAMLLIVGAMVIRYLGPGDYGKLAYIIAIVAFFQPIVNLGIDGIFVRDITAMGKHSSIGKKPEASHNRSIDAEVIDYVSLFTV
jgi:O-antigen/teichoic acid export membrane protein